MGEFSEMDIENQEAKARLEASDKAAIVADKAVVKADADKAHDDKHALFTSTPTVPTQPLPVKPLPPAASLQKPATVLNTPTVPVTIEGEYFSRPSDITSLKPYKTTINIPVEEVKTKGALSMFKHAVRDTTSAIHKAFKDLHPDFKDLHTHELVVEPGAKLAPLAAPSLNTAPQPPVYEHPTK